ncbi:MAG: glutamine amidotransferase [Candidatus Nanopelagicales bacterium]|jgi:CobQ-like glutamine amidotransferase family enzyme|nr:glutamine amidotransferase [Candidatus Nanopelagicales bacterium]MCU0298884.1 glutamine amidotransferase [Candidatus Nanopelagicales bacterium]
MSTLTLASIYPTLLGTYGDGGNVMVLRHRAALHGIDVDIVIVDPGEPVPESADVYVLGGGEDSAQTAAANALRADGALTRAAEHGAVVLAICAGYQLLGEYFPDSTSTPTAGLGILDIRTDRLPQRAVGELAATPKAPFDQILTGYENHAGATHLGSGARALGMVRAGIGNGDGSEGATSGHVIGTYLHGPCLARNPQIADTILSWATGRELAFIEEPEVTALREERLKTVLG